MVTEVVDFTLTKPRSRWVFIKRLRRLWLGLFVVGLLFAASLLWNASPKDLGIGNRLLTSHMLPLWRDGDLIVLVRHEERCDRSTNPCLGPVEGLTINGSQNAEALGKAFKTLGMEGSDVLASPTIRTAQTLRFMFGKNELTSGQQAVCGAAMGEELLSHKTPGRNPQRLHRRLRKHPGFSPCRVPQIRQRLVRAGIAQRKIQHAGHRQQPGLARRLKTTLDTFLSVCSAKRQPCSGMFSCAF
jgi:hypothetical protein